MLRGSKLLPAIVGAGVLAGVAVFAAISGPPADPNLQGLPGFASYQPIAGCIEELPPGIEEPQYRPRTLTLPDGSVAIRTVPDPAPGLHVVVYRSPASLEGFVDHVTTDWPAQGWQLGRGEREQGEAEAVFFTPDKSRYGQFRARSVYCDLEQVEVTLTLGEDVRSTP